jgi:hypothetical protein
MKKIKDLFYYATDEDGLFNPIYLLKYSTLAFIAIIILHLIN